MNGAERIAAERQRQIAGEGWTAEHDAKHVDGDLAKAAVVYALSAIYPPDAHGNPRWTISGWWPRGWTFKTADPVRMLEKAGALIAAEIDRLHAPPGPVLRNPGDEFWDSP